LLSTRLFLGSKDHIFRFLALSAAVFHVEAEIIHHNIVPRCEPKFLGGPTMTEHDDPRYEYLRNPREPDADYDLSSFYFQDQMAMETQGAVLDRSLETLGVSDRGVILFRNMLDEQIALVESGNEPTVAVVRDPEKNRIIAFDDISQPWGSTSVLSFTN